jgi:glucose/arabinose dehydrogenase
LIGRGNNYGWPVISYGMNYNGKPLTDKTAAPGMEQSQHYWTPSIAVCGMDFYEGDAFPDWKYNLFVGGVASKELHRLVVEDGAVRSDEIILKDLGRVRDVRSEPDGALYIVLNGPDQIVRLLPVR